MLVKKIRFVHPNLLEEIQDIKCKSVDIFGEKDYTYNIVIVIAKI